MCGVLQFTYKVSTSDNVFVFFYEFFHYGITTLVILLSVIGYLIFCKSPVLPENTKTYSQAKIGFGYNYETTNPITKLKGDINYLYDVLKHDQDNLKESRIISDLLNLSRSSLDEFSKRKGELYRIKLRMQKKMSSDNHHMMEMSHVMEREATFPL